MPSTTILEEIEAEKTAQQRLRHLSSVSSLPSADLAFIDGFWERHLADMPGRDGYPEGCLLLLDDVRAVLSGSVGALLVIAPQHYNCIEIFDKDHSLIADWTPETAQERHLRQQLSLQALETHGRTSDNRITKRLIRSGTSSITHPTSRAHRDGQLERGGGHMELGAVGGSHHPHERIERRVEARRLGVGRLGDQRREQRVLVGAQ